MSVGAIDPKVLISEELSKRLSRNPRYSLRAFSKACGVSHTVLSLVLNGKRKLSKKAGEKIADFVGLSPEMRNALVPSNKKNANPRIKSRPSVFKNMSVDTFSFISEWYHLAILSLLEIENAKLEAKWISKQLGISELEASLAIDRLKRIGLVVQDSNGSWKQSGLPIAFDNKHSTSATRNYQRQLLQKGLDSIESHAFEDRDFSSMTLAMSASQLEYAKKKIKAFKRKLTAELESQGSPDAVFEMVFQLFPVTPIQRRKL